MRTDLVGARAALDRAVEARLPERTATGDDPVAIRDAAKQFEAVFMHQVFKSMRATVPREGLMDAGFGGEVFTDMLDQEYATLASRSGELGLADLIAEQLGAPADPGASTRRLRAARAYAAPAIRAATPADAPAIGPGEDPK